MWKASVVNWATNIFGTVAGGPQLVEAYFCFQTKDYGCAVEKAAQGLGIIAVAYFVGKKTVEN